MKEQAENRTPERAQASERINAVIRSLQVRKRKCRAWDGKAMHYDSFVIYPEDGSCEFLESGWDLHGYKENMLLMDYLFDDICNNGVYELDIIKAVSGLANDATEYIGYLSREYYTYGLVLNGHGFMTIDELIDMNCSFEILGNMIETPDRLG